MSKVKEAQEILRAFDFDRRRTNEASTRTLLALAGMNEQTSWADATKSAWASGRSWTGCAARLTTRLRRTRARRSAVFVLHQFVDAGILPLQR